MEADQGHVLTCFSYFFKFGLINIDLFWYVPCPIEWVAADSTSYDTLRHLLRRQAYQ
jgi:hypothetical protein